MRDSEPQTTPTPWEHESREDHARSIAQRLRDRAERTQAHIDLRSVSRFMSAQTISDLQAEVEADGAAAIYLEIAIAKGALA